jgi:prepilin-type N-terminal cleavage/methylation domain-containing protein
MKDQGFTLIEFMIVIAILCILAAVIYPAVVGRPNGASPPAYSMGINGVIEERCIAGFKFVVGGEGRPTQVLDQFGKGVACD